MIKCNYCGRENHDETAPCPGCGTPPAGSDEAEGKQGNPISVLGLLDCVIGVISLAGGRIDGMFHIVKGLWKLDSPGTKNSPHMMLERAASSEHHNPRRAIALYEQIVRDYPGTRAAKEACRNIQTLIAAHPKLADLTVASPNREERTEKS